MSPAPLLVFGIGNPSRGDDALGPTFVEQLGVALARDVEDGRVELLTDFQLQIEHALDLTGRARVVFVDASETATPPFEMSRIAPRRDTSPTSHALTPEAVLFTHREVVGDPPESWTLAIRGERFELGEGLSTSACAHLAAALDMFVSRAGRGAGFGPAAALSARSETAAGRRIEIEGTVQGVGFRPWTLRVARSLGVAGCVWNTATNVTIEAFGPPSLLEALVAAVQRDPPAAARIRSVRVSPIAVREMNTFSIVASVSRSTLATGSSAELVLPADIATCEECARDVLDPGGRHHRYPFTSCTRCGPRLSITRSLPFDRAATTMADFPPCAACAREHDDPEDRRFHAQTIACASCGPRVWLARSDTLAPVPIETPSIDAVDLAVARLQRGAILGVQGLGAFHLVCDATRADVVLELRRRKRRDAQPFAVLVADLASAEGVAELDDPAREALVSAARPIVLAPARSSSIALGPVSGPSRRVGVMLPHSPLYLRLATESARPLVVTSGNRSGGPAVIDHAEARAVLGRIVDAFLLHDRPIVRRVEDSVVGSSPTRGLRLVRRSRGHAPLPIRLPASVGEPVLAVGGHMKCTAGLAVGDNVYLTPHLGELGLVESEDAWRRDLDGFERLLGVRAEVIAHDLHPGYASTRYALERPARRRIGVQHHVAHVLAAVAELDIDEPVVGVAYDGSGWGPDGTSWGAEILVVDGARWFRASTFRPIALAGGERAIREVWRVALAALHASFGGEAEELASRLPGFEGISRSVRAAVLRMIETDTEVVQARGMGRWFDAIGCLTLGVSRASFDGHVALALEEIVDTSYDAPPYPMHLSTDVALDVPIDARHEIDLRPAVRAVVADLIDGRDAAQIAGRFHQTIVEATSRAVERVLGATGLRRVVLTGGSFQNRILERGVLREIGEDRVHMAREVPLNDGGLALGQAWAAALALESNHD